MSNPAGSINENNSFDLWIELLRFAVNFRSVLYFVTEFLEVMVTQSYWYLKPIQGHYRGWRKWENLLIMKC
jgi:hypothetical protein